VEFLAGIYLFNVFAKFKKPNFGSVGFSLLEIASVAMLFTFILLRGDISLVYRHTFYYWIPTGILVFVFSFQAGFLSRLLSARWLVYFGELSYGFYLWHYIIVFMFNLWNNQYLHISNSIVVLILDFSLTIILSHLTFIWIEKPGKKFILKKMNTWQQRIPQQWQLFR
jgi:peptidoglycan/LPS O-acetylase OafA/YrhL